MPGVGHHGLRAEAAAPDDGVAVDGLLHHDGEHGGHEGHATGPGQHLAAQIAGYGAGAVPEDAGPHEEEEQSDEGGGEGFVLAVTVAVVLVARLAGDAHKDDHDDVGEEVGE